MNPLLPGGFLFYFVSIANDILNKLFCKGQRINNLGFLGLMVSVRLLICLYTIKTAIDSK